MKTKKSKGDTVIGVAVVVRPQYAKAGDVIAPKAREALARAMGGNLPLVLMPERVIAKTYACAGQWFCVTCGALPQNNMQAETRQESEPSHKLGWRGPSGEIEEP